ncbi:MAG: Swt1 family HEPN domain-containing protein [Gallionella sp.]|nr:Swt1 family HEPN domain-containing protein [Gallionella sp.]
MNNLLRSFTDELRSILAVWLPQLSADWWERHVLSILTYQQQERIKQSRIDNLSGLDLAALLRVLDQNWFELSSRFNWPKEGRNWLKEAQTIRNRWAHVTAAEAEPHDAYRDADTLERLAKMLGVGDAAQTQIADYKQQQLALFSPSVVPAPPLSPAVMPPAPVAPAVAAVPQATTIQDGFAPGQLVRLKSNRDKVFPVLSVLPNSGGERRYSVFENNKQANYYESQLESIPDVQDERTPIPLAEFHARLTSLLLTAPSSANLYSLHSGRVRYVPYQYRPVLKLLRADRPRLLIADDVGVGKTIEAGLILKELQARAEIKSVLILCPKPLVRVMSALVVVKAGIESHPDYYQFKRDFGWANDTHTGTNTDYTIINLEGYLKKKSIPSSRLVWHALIGAAPDVTKARYSPMRKHTPRTYDSHLVHYIKNFQVDSGYIWRVLCAPRY